MGREPILYARKNRIGYIETSITGRSIIRDKMNRKIGELKPSGNRIVAYDGMLHKLGYYDKFRDATFDTMNKKIGKGNLLLNFFF